MYNVDGGLDDGTPLWRCSSVSASNASPHAESRKRADLTSGPIIHQPIRSYKGTVRERQVPVFTAICSGADLVNVRANSEDVRRAGSRLYLWSIAPLPVLAAKALERLRVVVLARRDVVSWDELLPTQLESHLLQLQRIAYALPFLSTRPGRAPVCFPSSITGSPATNT